MNNKNDIDSNGVLQYKTNCKIVINPKTKKKALVFPKKGIIKQLKNKLFILDKNFEEVTIPDTVQKIGKECFKGCSNLESIIIPDSVTEIEKDCLSFCSSLSNLYISHNITTIPENSFFACTKLSNIEIPCSVTSLGNNCFSGCSRIKHINVPENIINLGEGIFWHCTLLEDFNFNNNNIIEIPRNMFNNCISLNEITLPSNLQKINTMAFWGCESLRNIHLPDDLKHIGESAFGNCYSLKSITIPPNVTSIESCAFENCSDLESVTISSRYLKSVGEDVFLACNNIKELNVPQNLLKNNIFDFNNMPNLKSIIYNNKQVLNLDENETFNNLINNGKYIYISYNDKNNNTVYSIENNKTNMNNAQINESDLLNKNFSKLINHSIFKDVKDDSQTICLCLNMMSVLNIDTCEKFLDILYKQQEDRCNKITKSSRKQNMFFKFINKIKSFFSNNSLNNENSFNLSSIEKINKLFSKSKTNLDDINCKYFDKFFSYNIEQISNIDDIDLLNKICEIQNHFDKFMNDVFLKRKCEKCNSTNLSDIANNKAESLALTLDEVLSFEKLYIRPQNSVTEAEVIDNGYDNKTIKENNIYNENCERDK